MKAAQTGGPDYDARMRRARHLAAAHPFAAEVLTFYERLAAFQKDFYAKVRGSCSAPGIAGAPGELRSELKLGDLLRQFPELLALLASAGPAPVAEAARSMASRRLPQPTGSARAAVLLRCWESCGRKAMAGSAGCCVPFVCRSGTSGEFFARLAARKTKRNCRCTWRSNFRTFAWRAATPASFICEPLI